VLQALPHQRLSQIQLFLLLKNLIPKQVHDLKHKLKILIVEKVCKRQPAWVAVAKSNEIVEKFLRVIVA
jgi:hypothetical protein